MDLNLQGCAPLGALPAREGSHNGAPAILKTARLGYDGKGQVRITDQRDLEDAWAAMGRPDAILEGVVDFTMEISAIVARDGRGAIRAFDVVANIHRDGILAETRAPAPLPGHVSDAARSMAGRLAAALVNSWPVDVRYSRNRLRVNELARAPLFWHLSMPAAPASSNSSSAPWRDCPWGMRHATATP